MVTKAMKTKINIDDFLTLIYWVKTFYQVEGKKFNYEGLVDQAETYKLKDTPLDTKIHHIDELMIDAFKIYDKLKEKEEQINNFFDNDFNESFKEKFPLLNMPMFKDMFNKETLLGESNKYKRIFEDLMENYKYDDPETRGIQRGFLGEKMKEYVAVEDYENAARVRDMIKEV